MAWTTEDFEAMRRHWGNNTLVGWKLIYTDRSVWRSTDGPFDAAPTYGVQVLIKYYRRPRGGYSREVQNGLDLYVLYSDRAEHLDLPPQIKAGQNLTNAAFDAILAEARADTETVIGLHDADLHPEN